MENSTLDQSLIELRAALDLDDLEQASTIVEALRPADQAELFTELNDEEQAMLLPELNPVDSADIFEEMPDEAVATLVAGLSTETIISIIDEMEPDEAADLLGDIQEDQAEAVLAGLDDPDEIRPLMLHPDDSAGGLMTSAYLALRRRMTTAEAIQAIRDWHPTEETIYYLFVVDRERRLCGVINLRQLIVADPTTLLSEIMNPEVISVVAGTDQEAVAQLMKRYDLLALPVVDSENKVLGIITVDDVMDVLTEEALEDIQRLGATEPLDRPYLDTPIFTLARKRIGWLLMLFLTATLTGSVMRLFEGELQAVVALAIFIPMLIGTGGNAGAQTTATIIRALATNDVKLKDAFWVWWQEARVGLLLGVGMSIVAFIRAITWQPSVPLAFTISTSILAIVLWATGTGALLPLLATRLRIDPTVVSGPAMSTLVDATGLFIYFSIARFMLGL